RILVDNSGYALTNMGDVAMLQGGVTRLRRLWPDADVAVLTSRPERLARYVPSARPVIHRGRDQYIAPGAVLGRLGRSARGAEDMIRLHLPDLTRRIVTWRRRRRRREWQHVAPFLECLSAADL